MLDQAKGRTTEFQRRLRDAGIDVAIITDESSIAYLAGFWGYLSVEFGRPTFLLVRPEQAPVVITPLMESEMVSAMTWVENIQTWQDSGPSRWENVLKKALGDNPGHIGVESAALPPIVRNWFDDQMPGVKLNDISTVMGSMRNNLTNRRAFRFGSLLNVRWSKPRTAS